MTSQKIAGPGKVIGRHLLVQQSQRFRVRCFQSHGDFQLTRKAIAKPQYVGSAQPWMVFDDHRAEWFQQGGDGRVVLSWNRFAVKEIAAVVQLDAVRVFSLLQCEFDLSGNRTNGNSAGCGVLPQVAHQAAEWTFSIRQKDGQNVPQHSIFLPFFLFQDVIRHVDINVIPGPTSVQDVMATDFHLWRLFR